MVHMYDELVQLGCSHGASQLLDAAYKDSCGRLADSCNELMTARLADLWRTFRVGEEPQYGQWQSTLFVATERRYAEAVGTLRDRLLDEVRSAQDRHAHSPSQQQQLQSEQESGAFTPEVLVILHAAFQAAEHVTKAERRHLAGATGLSERQILTWVRPLPLLAFEHSRSKKLTHEHHARASSLRTSGSARTRSRRCPSVPRRTRTPRALASRSSALRSSSTRRITRGAPSRARRPARP